MGKPTPLDPNAAVNSTSHTASKSEEEKRSRNRHLKIGTWNVRRGLITREIEIINLLESEKLDVLFLTETDTKKQNATGYKIKGFNTFVQLKKSDEDMVRIIALVKEEVGLNLKLREDLMDETFPSVWLEAQDKFKSATLIGGFYRQWSDGGKLTVPEQVSQINQFCDQINLAASSNTNSKLIVTGDANLCGDNWKKDDYDRKSVAQPLLHCLEQNGLLTHDVGTTFQADHLQSNGSVSSSALDHVYSSEILKECIKVTKVLSSASDHLPVLVQYSLDLTRIRYKHSITKRSFKNFTKESWNLSLSRQDWLDVDDCANVNEMVTVFNKNIEMALDEVAPVKTFTIRSNHRFGLTDSTKELMKKRDFTRGQIKSASVQQKGVLLQQYKAFRNKVTSKIRKENVDFNNNRIEKAANERELWQVANDVLNPKKENDWKVINKDGTQVTEELEVAEVFNEFFVEKVNQLKNGIDPIMKEDPFVRLQEKMKNNKCRLEFKTITQKQLVIHLKKLKKRRVQVLTVSVRKTYC